GPGGNPNVGGGFKAGGLRADVCGLAPALCANASPSPASAWHSPPPYRATGSQTVSEPVVETQELAVRFGGVLAVDHVNFVLRERELRCLIGPNGAGKSTFFKSLTGQIRGANASGRVLIRGQETPGWSTHNIV